MEYHEAVAYLDSLQRYRPKLGLETTARLLEGLGDPRGDVEFVQIAGSNGKGSTARMLESALLADGLDVGLFTSPKLNDVRDQLRVNGRPVPKERFAGCVDRLEPIVEARRAADDAPTAFEALAALAMHHFGASEVDVAILEVGIGGRYDATSVVDPVASAVTSVSLEHTDLLGDTVEEIARDKAQVAPTDRPLVTGASGPALDAIRTETDVVTVGPSDADVTAVERGIRDGVEGAVSIDGPDWALTTRLQLLGAHQATNAGVTAALARQVADVPADTIAEGLRAATWPGRFEVVSRDPLTVLDGSHNPGAAETMGDLLGRFDYDDLHLVFGAMADKDAAGMLDAFPPIDAAYVTRANVDRAAGVDALADHVTDRADRWQSIKSVPEATERALIEAGPDDAVLVTGSLSVVAEARDRWSEPVIPKARGRPPSERAAFSGVPTRDRDHEAVDTRTGRINLRPPQAKRVAAELDAAGGTARRSPAGAPGNLVATTLSGTVAELRTLAESLADAGLGLGRVADDLDRMIDGAYPAGPFGDGTAVLGILNVTPDSFHDGGEYDRFDAAVARAEAMVAAGADAVDVGGESTRPGADPVSVETEVDRVVPVVEALSSLDVPISVDTRKAAVADAALDAGADVVNDVSGLADPEMRFVVADHDASLVLMHSLSTPVDPGRTWTYGDVVEDVIADLAERILFAERAGIDRERIVVDPGLGFGKAPAESFALLDRLPELRALGCPLLVGHSRKSMFGDVAGEGDRLPPTLAGTAMAVERGADAVRVHDVSENAAVVRTVAASEED
jgi:dihydropteroate synthase